MINTIEGNVLAVPKGIIVHGCNCQGVMGAGVALQIKNIYPAAYKVYRDKYESRSNPKPGDGLQMGLQLGEITFAEVEPFKIIVNANTQYSCGGDKRYVDYEAVAQCFEKVERLARMIENTNSGKKLDIFFPMIGAGLAGGNWNIISTIIDETVSNDFNKTVVVYKP